MSAYESLAACYDELTYDIPYEKTLTFFERLCAREHVQPHSVLDLACGTGSLSLLLARRGYRVIGADLSSDMLAEAEQKAQALPENRPFFICQPMQRLRLAEPVDAVICALDSLNYVTKPADCRKTFRRVYDALTPGGLFVFDINTPAKLRGLDGQVFLDETDDTYCGAPSSTRKSACAITAWTFSVWKGSTGSAHSKSISNTPTNPRSCSSGSRRRASPASVRTATACCALPRKPSSASIFPQRRSNP